MGIDDSPSRKKGDDATHEEQPDSPTRSPETTTRTLTNWTSIEAVVDQMLQVLRHSNLTHELVLVSVHSRQSTNVSEDVLEGVG